MQHAKPLGDAAFRGPFEAFKTNRDTPALGPERIVPLFVAPDAPEPAQDDAGMTEQDWQATLNLVRQVSAQVRHTDESSKDLARSAQACIQHANERIEEARARAEAAEAAARHAEKRAQDAEARAGQAEERVQAAERRAQAAGREAQNADARAREAQAWAKRLQTALKEEFGAVEVGAVA